MMRRPPASTDVTALNSSLHNSAVKFFTGELGKPLNFWSAFCRCFQSKSSTNSTVFICFFNGFRDSPSQVTKTSPFRGGSSHSRDQKQWPPPLSSLRRSAGRQGLRPSPKRWRKFPRFSFQKNIFRSANMWLLWLKKDWLLM